MTGIEQVKVRFMKVVTAAEAGQFYTEEKQKRFNSYVPDEGTGCMRVTAVSFGKRTVKKRPALTGLFYALFN